MHAPSPLFRLLAGGLVLSLCATWSFAGGEGGDHGKSRHKKTPDLEVTVTFLNPEGQTVTDSSGTTFEINSWADTIPLLYQPQYWGTFPLYLLGDTASITVTVSNTTPKGHKPLKLRIEGASYTLNTDGSLGVAVGAPLQWVIVELKPGESRTLSGSIAIPLDPNLPSGLDETRIRIYQRHGDEDADDLLLEHDALWCPPALAIRP